MKDSTELSRHETIMWIQNSLREQREHDKHWTEKVPKPLLYLLYVVGGIVTIALSIAVDILFWLAGFPPMIQP